MKHIIRHQLDIVDSTNAYLLRMAEDPATPEGTLVVARGQTAGRGRQGNAWVSLDGNLFMSLLLRPEVVPADVGQLSFVLSVALARCLRPMVPPGCLLGLKWPNDLLLDGRKLSGILLESAASATALSEHRIPWVVAGIGVNLKAAPDGAASLAAVRGAEAPLLSPLSFLDLFEPHIISLYNQWREEGFAPIGAAWLEQALHLGENITVRLPKETVQGRFLGLTSGGGLVLGLADGATRHILSGEVFL